MSFSEPAHIPLIMKGIKTQTTRLESSRKIEVGDILHLYYKSRMKKYSCENCINPECAGSQYNFATITYDDKKKAERLKVLCESESLASKSLRETHWNNLYGHAPVVDVHTICFAEMTSEAKEAWAKKDGFSCWAEAVRWFNKKYGQKMKYGSWKFETWRVVSWRPGWV